MSKNTGGLQGNVRVFLFVFVCLLQLAALQIVRVRSVCTATLKGRR